VRVALLVGTVLSAQYASVGSASADDGDRVAHSAAVDLFDAAERALAAGKVAEACPKYAESYRLDPQLGVLLHWADCLERDGKLATAYARFRDAEELATRRGDARQAFALSRIRSLEPRLNRIVLTTEGAAWSEGMNLTLDGVLIAPSSFGIGIAVDAGPHVATATAPGHESLRVIVDVQGEGSVARVAFPILPPRASSDKSQPSTPQARNSDPNASYQTRRIIGITAASVGVVAAGIGAGFLVDMGNQLNARSELCPAAKCPPGTDREEVRELERDAVRSQALGLGFVIGGVLAITGGVGLYLVSTPSHHRSGAALDVRSTPGGAECRVSWVF